MEADLKGLLMVLSTVFGERSSQITPLGMRRMSGTLDGSRLVIVRPRSQGSCLLVPWSKACNP